MFTVLRQRARPVRLSQSGAFAGVLFQQARPSSASARISLQTRPSKVRDFATRAMEAESSTEDDEQLQLEDDGEYEIIVPKDPYTKPEFPPPRAVPAHILRPSYALPTNVHLYKDTGHFIEPYTGDGLIALGSENEKKLRRAAAFARRVLNMAGTLAVVSFRLCWPYQ